MNMKNALVWFRRDLRDYDHTALAAALADSTRVFCVFIFDRHILDSLPSRQDRRVEFIHGALEELHEALHARGGGLIVRMGLPEDIIPELANALQIHTVYANEDYEPGAKDRDEVVKRRLTAGGHALRLFKDHVIFRGSEVHTQAGRFFTVFTPYRNAWLRHLTPSDMRPRDSGRKLSAPSVTTGVPKLSALGFLPTNLRELGIVPGMSGARAVWQDFVPRLEDYAQLRDYPACKGVSYLSVHLRFGTISIRELVRTASELPGEGPRNWLSELIWREFYAALLDQAPWVTHRSFRPQFDTLAWDDWPEALTAWKAGLTGFPLVDAGMRQLAQSGWMHNRLRMVTASFLCKDLGINWRHGEQHFADHLIDFDLASNNGGWQWAASTGCDAQPWFRIFNPVTQSEKFDPRGQFIRRYLPELAMVPDRHIHAPWKMSPAEQAASGVMIGRDYPLPLVDHGRARKRTLARYGQVSRPDGPP